jgi:hypothetical protein
VKFNRPGCSHACLLWYGSSRVSSDIGKNNQNSSNKYQFYSLWFDQTGLDRKQSY